MRRYKEKKMFSGKNICIALMALMVGVIAWPERRLLIRTNGEHQSAIPFATLTYNNDSNFANEDNSTIVTILTNRVSVTANESAQLSNHPQQVSKQDNVIYDNSIKRPTSTLLQHVNNKSRLAPIDPTQQWVSSAKLNSSSSTAQLLLFNLINDGKLMIQPNQWFTLEVAGDVSVAKSEWSFLLSFCQEPLGQESLGQENKSTKSPFVLIDDFSLFVVINLSTIFSSI